MALRIVQAELGDPAAAPLLDGLAAEYTRLYGEGVSDELERYRAAEFRPPHGALLLLVDGRETVAGGALRRLAPGIGEIKRMWTAPEHRRRGHARRVLAALEDVAAARGYRAIRLETGTPQVGAADLYRAAGYRPIPGYGRYGANDWCLSFEKPLVTPAIAA